MTTHIITRPEVAGDTPAGSGGITERTAARIAGVGYALLFVLAVFSNFLVRENLTVVGDPAATFANIAESQTLFRAGLLGFLVVFLLDVLVAWALYIVFRAASAQVSRLSAWFRLVYTVFLGVAAVFFAIVLQLVSGAEHLAAFEQGQLESQVTLLLDAFNFTWLVGLAAFGVHLMLISYMVFTSRIAPRLLGHVLGIAGAAYVIDTAAHTMLANYTDYADLFLMMVLIPSVVAEAWFTVWLLRGGAQRRSVSG